MFINSAIGGNRTLVQGDTKSGSKSGKGQRVWTQKVERPCNCNKEDFLYLSITNNLTPAAWAADGTGKDQPMSISVLADFAFVND